MSTKVAIVASHPIQYFAPWYAEMNRLAEINLKVFYCCDWGVNEYLDPKLGVSVKWDVPLLEGYEHEFLPIARRPQKLGFWELDNPTVGDALARFKPDVVKLYGYARRTNWRVARWARKHGKLLLMMSDSNAIARPVYWKRALKELIVRRFYRYLDGALAISDNNWAYHQHFGLPAERLFRALFPVDRTRLLAQVPDAAQARAEIRRQYGIPADAFVALLCGKYVDYKRPLDLVAANHAAAQQGLPVWTLLVGEGSARPTIENYLHTHGVKNCTLTGFVNQSRISSYYAAADVLTVPSSLEPYSLTAGEGAIFGLPIIASDQVGCVGPHGPAQPGVNTIVFPVGDVAQLSAAISELCRNRALYQRLAQASAALAATQDIVAATRIFAAAIASLQHLGRRAAPQGLRTLPQLCPLR